MKGARTLTPASLAVSRHEGEAVDCVATRGPDQKQRPGPKGARGGRQSGATLWKVGTKVIRCAAITA
jgi:hypothetical protein